MNSIQNIIPKLNSLWSEEGKTHSTFEPSSAFSQALQTAIEDKSTDSGSQSGSSYHGLGYAIASLLSSGMENDEGMMMLLSALASQEDETHSFVKSDLNHSVESLNAIGKKAAQAYQSTYETKNSFVTNDLTARPIYSTTGGRSPVKYRTVIDQFNVEENKRYAVSGTGSTYCNIYVSDVTRAMGAEVPHYIDRTTGQPLPNGKSPNATAMNANRMNDWLNKHGATYGWHKVSPEVAQHFANEGKPAVTSWKNSLGHGHIQIVSPSLDGGYDPKKGVAISQAGSKLIKYGHIEDVYRTSNLKNIDYFVHD